MHGERAMREAIVQILTDLIAMPSTFPPGESRQIAAYCADRLRRTGYRVEVLWRRAGVDNVVARMGAGQPSLAFNCHIDTVGPGDASLWRTDPFRATVIDDRVHGLGASNCKGAAAVQLWLAEEIARRGGPRNGEVVFTFVPEEENLGPDGLRFLRDSGAIKPDYLVVGAETENQLIIEERGVLWARLVTTGTAAHAGAPQLGDNAILRMMRVLDRLDREMTARLATRVAGAKHSTYNVGKIRGGENTNVVPARCEIEIDRRLLPEERIDDAFAELEHIVASAGEPEERVIVERITGTNGFRMSPDEPCVRAFAEAVATVTGAPARFLESVGVYDGRYFADDGIEILDLGPGEGGQGHSPNESVSIAMLEQSAAIHLRAVASLLGFQTG
jgi:acetylornithine deacetylase/succinyl-diaminopimelate desuccinylase family protein